MKQLKKLNKLINDLKPESKISTSISSPDTKLAFWTTSVSDELAEITYNFEGKTLKDSIKLAIKHIKETYFQTEDEWPVIGSEYWLAYYSGKTRSFKFSSQKTINSYTLNGIAYKTKKEAKNSIILRQNRVKCLSVIKKANGNWKPDFNKSKQGKCFFVYNSVDKTITNLTAYATQILPLSHYISPDRLTLVRHLLTEDEIKTFITGEIHNLEETL